MSSPDSIIEVQDNNGEYTMGSTVNFFRLYPNTSPDKPWGISYYKEGDYVNVTPEEDSPFQVEFLSTLPEALAGVSANAKQALLAQQSTVFIVDIMSDSNNDWRFWQDGIIWTEEQNYYQYKITTERRNQGKTLVLTICNVVPTVTSLEGVDEDALDFRFSAIRFNPQAGGSLDQVFYSQDPIIVVKRPPAT